MAHQQEFFLSFSCRQSLSCCLSRMVLLLFLQNLMALSFPLQNYMALFLSIRTTWSSLFPIHFIRTVWTSTYLLASEPRGSLSLWLPCLGLNPSAHLPLQPHFQPLLQSVTPASIPVFFQLYWAAIVSPGRCGPMAWSQSSPSSHTGPVTRGVASQSHLGWNLVPSPWLKAGPQLFNISMKLVKGYRYVKWLPGVSCKAVATQNSSDWPCSMCPIPPGSGLWEWGHPTYIFLIFPGHLEFWTPLQIPSWVPPLGCTLLHYQNKFIFWCLQWDSNLSLPYLYLVPATLTEFCKY